MNSIRKKLAFGILSITTFIIIIGYTIGIAIFLNDKREESRNLAKSIETVIAQDMAKLIFLNSVYFATDITTKLKSFPSIKSLIVYNLKNQPVYHFSGGIIDNNKNIFQTKLVITYKNNKIGYMYIELFYDTFFDIVKRYWFFLVLFYLLTIFIAYIISWYYAKKFTKPIFDLIEFLDSINLSSLDKRIFNMYSDEFGKLYSQTNEMLENLQLSIIKAQESKNESLFFQTHDKTTMLLNKEAFLKEYQENLNKSNKDNLIVAIDIKGFHKINEIHSYQIGDKLLLKITENLRTIFKDSLLGRIGSDVFILAYYNFEKKEINSKIDNIINIFKSFKNIKIDDESINLSFYIGINYFVHKDANKALREVDIALNSAKEKNIDILFFSRELEDELFKKDLLKKELEIAIKNDEIVPYFQLQFKSDKIVYGAEVLARWRHPKKGILPPAIFIPIAEQNGLTVDIGNIMLDKACQQLAVWSKNKKTKNWHLSVNVDNTQFNELFVDILKSKILKYNIDPSLLTIEILENIFLENSKENIELLNKIKELGIEISLDDFGTGFSSLQYIKSLPIDEIKIDQNFVFGMFKNKTDIAIIKSIIFLGNELGIKVLAEGVETKEHYEKLKHLSCRLYQGYYFEKPQPIEYIQKKYIDS